MSVLCTQQKMESTFENYESKLSKCECLFEESSEELNWTIEHLKLILRDKINIKRGIGKIYTTNSSPVSGKTKFLQTTKRYNNPFCPEDT